MTGNRTLTMIKPVAVKNNYTAAIFNKITEAGFRIVALKMTRLDKLQAEEFYEEHRGKEFFGRLTDFMSGGYNRCSHPGKRKCSTRFSQVDWSYRP